MFVEACELRISIWRRIRHAHAGGYRARNSVGNDSGDRLALTLCLSLSFFSADKLYDFFSAVAEHMNLRVSLEHFGYVIQINVIDGGSRRMTARSEETRIVSSKEIVSMECHNTNGSRRIRQKAVFIFRTTAGALLKSGLKSICPVVTTVIADAGHESRKPAQALA
ncbi:hypothetical protein C7441_105296 [Pseudaminobacter salicylatoxidans]|uniref:Uncharacterized protein n=2 Tax=Pseudaminobacter salicylatoxidans TaxID=93369 RepID=A0A316C6L2_PSESE|nr:hypothetical protein C7441_105296 [Pseudaminobacter salicylatoxidans]